MRQFAQAYWASLLALICYVIWLTFILILHVVTDDHYDPAAQMISQLALGRYGELLNISLIVMGIGTIALAVALYRSVQKIIVSPLVLTFAGLLWVVAGVFETGPEGPFGEGGGGQAALIHDLSALTAFMLIITAIFVTGLSFRRDPGWKSFARPTFVWAFAALAAFIAIPVAGAEFEGLAQRIHVAIWVSWFFVVALRIRAFVSS